MIDYSLLIQFNIAIHETKDTDFCFDIEYIKGITSLDPEGKRPEMKKGKERLLVKNADMKERAPPSQFLFSFQIVCSRIHFPFSFFYLNYKWLSIIPIQ